ncbi:MAG: hypothetical protein ACFFG0_22490 [Candidatus Thorarchaeota archaeon]
MGKAFGLVALLMAIIGIIVIALFFILVFTIGFIIPWWDLIVIILGALAIVFGIIGIAKDDSKGLGITGLILGIILEVVIWVVFPLVLVGLAIGGGLI